MPDLIQTLREHPARAIAVCAAGMCIGFGTCGVAALSNMRSASNTLLGTVAIAGAILFFVSALGLVIMLVVLLVRLLRGAFKQ